MRATVEQAPSRAHRRQRALDPYLVRLRERLSGSGVTLEPWAVAEIGAALEDPRAHPRGSLLAQAAALELKIAADRARMAPEAAGLVEELYERQAELMLDSAIGAALLREFQQIVDEEVRAGQMDLAKRWTRSRNALHATTSGLKRLLAESERRRVDVLADDWTDRCRVEQASPERYVQLMRRMAHEEEQRERLARARRRTRQALGHLPSRTELLVAALAILAAAWLGFVRLPQHFASPLRRLSLADLAHADGILYVEARPPSLYVTVDSRAWSELQDEERRRLVKALSGVLLASDYNGALLRTEEGRPVARWLARSGVGLIDHDERRPLPDGPSDADRPPALVSSP